MLSLEQIKERVVTSIQDSMRIEFKRVQADLETHRANVLATFDKDVERALRSGLDKITLLVYTGTEKPARWLAEQIAIQLLQYGYTTQINVYAVGDSVRTTYDDTNLMCRPLPQYKRRSEIAVFVGKLDLPAIC